MIQHCLDGLTKQTYALDATVRIMHLKNDKCRINVKSGVKNEI